MVLQSWPRLAWMTVSAVLTAAALSAQTAPPPTQTPVPRPTPFPAAGQPPASTPPKPATPTPGPAGSPQCATVDPATLDPLLAGIPLYPCAVYLETFDASSDPRLVSQRVFAFGTNDPYAEVVLFYKTQLKKSGEELSKFPAIHQFERGAFDSGTMAQRPGVVVKDYAWPAVTDAYLHVSGTTGTRYRTLIQVIPASK